MVACAATREAVGAAGGGWTARAAVCAAMREAVVVCTEGAGWTARAAACAAMREVVALCVAGAGWTVSVMVCTETRHAESGVEVGAGWMKTCGKSSSSRARQYRIHNGTRYRGVRWHVVLHGRFEVCRHSRRPRMEALAIQSATRA